MTTPCSPKGISVEPVGQAQFLGNHLLGLAAEDEFAEPDQEISEPDRRHQQDDLGLVDQGPHDEALDRQRQNAHDGDRQDERQNGRNAFLMEADQGECCEHDHDALGEIEHARGLEDQDKTQGNEGIEHARHEALPQNLGQEVGCPCHLREGLEEDLAQEVHHPDFSRATTPR